jgi:hypothetical protein
LSILYALFKEHLGYASTVTAFSLIVVYSPKTTIPIRKILMQLAIFWVGTALPAVVFAQSFASGKVMDATGNLLAGAIVSIKSTNIPTTTSNKGLFKIKVPDNKARLVISYVGYFTKTVVIENGEMTIKLEEDDSKLSEVVVTGLATTYYWRYNVAMLRKFNLYIKYNSSWSHH